MRALSALYLTFRKMPKLGPMGEELETEVIDDAISGMPTWQQAGAKLALLKANDIDYVAAANLQWWEPEDYEDFDDYDD